MIPSAALALPEELLDLLRGTATCYLSTLMPDGAPQVTQTWVDTDGHDVLINTVVGHQKVKNIQRDPRIAMAVGMEAASRLTSESRPRPFSATWLARRARWSVTAEARCAATVGHRAHRRWSRRTAKRRTHDMGCEAAGRGLPVVSLRFQVSDDRPDWPVVSVLVDGADPFAQVAPGWRGFDPSEMLGSRSPLLPQDPGRRVAVYRCSCGEAGCGVIAPVIVPSPDGRRISWVDFRDYTEVFCSPVTHSASKHEGRAWDLPDLHFDRDQYVAEVQRASRDGSWETAARKTARVLRERLDPLDLALPPDLRLRWTSPARSEAGIPVMFEHFSPEPEHRVRQQMLRLLSDRANPAAAAQDMARQLLATPASDWVRKFGWQPTRAARR